MTEAGPIGHITVNAARVRAEDEFLHHDVVLQHLLMFHRLGQGQLQSSRSSRMADFKFDLQPLPSVTDFAHYLIDRAQVEPLNFKRQLRLKKQMGYHLALLGGSRKHIRLFCGLSDSQARTTSENGLAESFLILAELPGLESSRILWQILASQFGVFYWNLAGSRMLTDVVFDAVLEAWFNVLQFFSKPEWNLIVPYAANIGLFLDWALWFREGRLSFQQCPHCHLVYVQQETVCPDDHDFMNAAPVAKKHGSPVDQNYDTVPDCPYCRLKLEISKKRPSSRNQSGTS